MATVQPGRSRRESVKRKLMRTIARSYRPGDRLPSVRQLSRMLSVAPNTAHTAVRELAQAGLLELHPRRGAFVTPGAPGASGSPGSPGFPGAPDARPAADVLAYITFRDQFVIDMLEGFLHRAQALGLSIRVEANPSGDLRLPDDVSAAVLFNPSRDWRMTCRPGQSVTVVSTGAQWPTIPTTGLDIVSVDQALGGRVAGQAMRGAGVTEAFFVGVGERVGRRRILRPTCGKRLAGFEAGLGHRVRPGHVSLQQSYGVPPGALAADEYLALRRRPAGVFCSTDELAAGFIKRIETLGLRPGVDCQIIGFDGQQRAADILGYPPATVLVPSAQMGERAAELLADRLRNPDQVSRQLRLGCTLRPGQTLCPVK